MPPFVPRRTCQATSDALAEISVTLGEHHMTSMPAAIEQLPELPVSTRPRGYFCKFCWFPQLCALLWSASCQAPPGFEELGEAALK